MSQYNGTPSNGSTTPPLGALGGMDTSGTGFDWSSAMNGFNNLTNGSVPSPSGSPDIMGSLINGFGALSSGGSDSGMNFLNSGASDSMFSAMDAAQSIAAMNDANANAAALYAGFDAQDAAIF